MSDTQRSVNRLLLFADENDAVLDYLEHKYALSPVHALSPLERILRLREWRKREIGEELRSVWSGSDDDDSGDDEWSDAILT